jgi:AraC-like DNA-binding protein
MMVRVHRARRLLAQGISPSEAAYRTGFYDQSHLTRCFRETLGATPGRYATGHVNEPARSERFS